MAHLRHQGPISSVAARLPFLASAGYDNRVILWDAATGVARAQGWHDHLVNHCEFSPDGQYLVSASSDCSARLWRLPALQLQAVFNGHLDDVDMASFSPDSQHVATCALDRTVRVFSLDGRCLHAFHGHTGNIISLLWRPDGNRLASSSVDGTVREWSLLTGREEACHRMDAVRTDTLVADARGRILAGDDCGRIAIIEGDAIRYVQAHEAGIKKLVLHAASSVLVSLSYDRSMVVWHMEAGDTLQPVQRTALPAVIWPRAAAVLDAQRILVGTFGTRPAIYDLARDAWDLEGVEAGPGINAITLHAGEVCTVGDAGIVRVAARTRCELGSLCNFLLSDGLTLFSGGQLGILFDALSGAHLYQHHAPLNTAALIEWQGERLLAIGTYTGEILLFALRAGAVPQLLRTLPVYQNAVKGLVQHGPTLFSVCASTEIAWHDLATWELRRRVPHAHDKIANACCRCADGLVATVARDRTLRLWRDGQADIHPSPHSHSIKALCASADGRRLLSGSYGGTLARFDLSRREWTGIWRPGTAGISSIAWDPAHRVFLAADYDGDIHVID